MTNEEILKKAIEKAVKNGWKSGYVEIDIVTAGTHENPVVRITGYYKSSHKDVIKYCNVDEKSLVFDHEFAKAFWGKDPSCPNCGSEEIVNDRYNEWDCAECGRVDLFFKWQYHLQEMVLEKNPIQYLEVYL